MPSPHQTLRDLMSQGICRGRLWGSSSVADTFLGWLFSVKGPFHLQVDGAVLPLLMLIKPPGLFHFTSSPFGTTVQNETSLTFLPQGKDIKSGEISKCQLLWAVHMLFPFLGNKKCYSILFKLNNIQVTNPIS